MAKRNRATVNASLGTGTFPFDERQTSINLLGADLRYSFRVSFAYRESFPEKFVDTRILGKKGSNEGSFVRSAYVGIKNTATFGIPLSIPTDTYCFHNAKYIA